MKISGDYSEEELVQSQNFYLGRTKLNLIFVAIIASAMIAYPLYRLIFISTQQTTLLIILDLMIFSLGIFIATIWFYYLPNKPRFFLRKHSLAGIPFQFEIDEQGLRSNEKKYPWGQFAKYKENSQFILLYLGSINERAIILPKRAFTDSQVDSLHEKLLAHKIKDAVPLERRSALFAVLALIIVAYMIFFRR